MKRKYGPTNSTRLAVLAACQADPTITLDELVKLIGKSHTTIYYHVCNLKKAGLITHAERGESAWKPAPQPKAKREPNSADRRKSRGLRPKKDIRIWKERTPRTKDTEAALQKRIDAIVAAATPGDGGGDVVHEYIHRHPRLRASRLA